ncbi:MAG: DMT family transporter [Gemmatimonadota bacterium]
MTAERALSPWLVLVVAVVAMSWAGPVIKLVTAPPQVVAAWRLVFAVAFIALVLAARGRDLLSVRLTRHEWLLAVSAGVMLAFHFWSWIASLQYTTVASSVVLVSMQPIFVAVFSGVFLQERATRVQWLGIGVACAGAMILALGDAHEDGALSRSALFGDALALIGAVLVAGYYVIGRRLRQRLDLFVYIGIVYGIAALVLITVIVSDPRAHMIGYPASDWWLILALAAGPMMLGHTGINYALKYVRAYVANIALLGEPVLATLIAWLLPQLREVPSLFTLAGAILIGTGILLGARRPGQPAA